MLKILSTSTVREFIPEFDGNRNLPANEQIKVRHKVPTVNMKEKLFPRKIDYTGNGEATMSIEVDRKKIVAEFVESIQNLSYLDANENEQKIATVDQLFKAPIEFDELIDELYTYFNDLISQKVNEKN